MQLHIIHTSPDTLRTKAYHRLHDTCTAQPRCNAGSKREFRQLDTVFSSDSPDAVKQTQMAMQHNLITDQAIHSIQSMKGHA
jgi:hypothetical protein